MAKFLTTSGTSHSIEDIIRTASKTLTLVTPFLQINKILEDRLKDADREGIEITIIYGKEKLDYSQEQILNSLEHLEVYYYEHLHAKCYYNEKSMVISSMNLYSFSEKNNREMGILIDAALDKELYREASKEVESIKQSSQPFRMINRLKDVGHQSFKKGSDPKHNGHQEILTQTSGNYNGKALSNAGDKSYKATPAKIQSNEIKPELSPKFSEPFNFHLPSLFKSLKLLYPYTKIEFEENENQIVIFDFPVRGIDLFVGGRIDFIFSNDGLASRVKFKAKTRLEESMHRIRFYWNNEKLNIYTERNFNPEVTIDGVSTKVNKFLHIIKYTADILKMEAV